MENLSFTLAEMALIATFIDKQMITGRITPFVTASMFLGGHLTKPKSKLFIYFLILTKFM